MRKTLLILITLAVVQITSPASAVELIADGGDPLTAMDVGEVTVANDGTNLIVTITIDTGDWQLAESHVHAATALADIPQTKKGNARPGKFDYCDMDPEASVDSPTQHTYTIPLADIGDGVAAGSGDSIVVAVHTAIEYVEIVEVPGAEPIEILHEESAWGEGPEISDGRDWAMYIDYVLEMPDLTISISATDPPANPISSDTPLAFTYTVENIGGEGPAGNSEFDVAGYLSDDDVLDAGDPMILGPGGSSGTYSVWAYHLAVGWSLDNSVTDGNLTAVAAGDYYLIMMVDATDAYPGVAESNEDNNTAMVQLTITAPAP